MALNHNILLETGTNEFEIVEFVINGRKPYHFCINVAKVMEVITFPNVIQVPDVHEAIIGTANIRHNLVPIIDLASWLGIHAAEKNESPKVIVTYFNGAYNGFMVDEVIRIHRVTWADIKDYSSMSDMELLDSVLGVIHIGENLVQLLDFEKIIAEINPTTLTRDDVSIDMDLYEMRKGKTIYLADDSTTIRKLLETNLVKAGYTVKSFENGKNLLSALATYTPDIVVTDLEMPGASGDFVVKRIRSNEAFKDTPIIVFSSMASLENERKLTSIGANLFIGKPELKLLIDSIDNFLLV